MPFNPWSARNRLNTVSRKPRKRPFPGSAFLNPLSFQHECEKKVLRQVLGLVKRTAFRPQIIKNRFPVTVNKLIDSRDVFRMVLILHVPDTRPACGRKINAVAGVILRQWVHQFFTTDFTETTDRIGGVSRG